MDSHCGWMVGGYLLLMDRSEILDMRMVRNGHWELCRYSFAINEITSSEPLFRVLSLQNDEISILLRSQLLSSLSG